MRHFILLPHVACLVAIVVVVVAFDTPIAFIVIVIGVVVVVLLRVACVCAYAIKKKTWPTYEFINRFLGSGKKGLQKLEDRRILELDIRKGKAHTQDSSLKICKAFVKQERFMWGEI